MKTFAHSLKLHSDGIKAKRVVRTSRIRPDMPRHEFEVVGQFTSNGGSAIPFGAVLRQVDNVAPVHGTNHETRGQACIGLSEAENLNPQPPEKLTSRKDQVFPWA